MKRTSFVQILAGSLFAVPIAAVILFWIGHDQILKNATIDLQTKLAAWTNAETTPVVIGDWPPIKGQAYPDLILHDQAGEEFRLSDHRGKTILIELVAIPCEGCQAFAGGNEVGSFAGVSVQRGLESIHQYAKRFAGTELNRDDLVFVQLILYSNSMNSPTDTEVRDWAEHFGMSRSDNQYVLRGDRSMLSRESFRMIPGFHLIDQDFVLQYDSCGHDPQDNLYTDLLPALGTMLRN